MKEIARIRNVDMPQSPQKQIDAAKSAIDERLKIWGTDCDGWLPKEVGLSTQDLFRRFYTYILFQSKHLLALSTKLSTVVISFIKI